jgi:hypothetical protein
MPIVFAALIDGVLRARRDSWQPLPAYVRAAPSLALLIGLIFSIPTAFGDLVSPKTYQPSPRAQAAERILSEIPDNATVETDFGVMARHTDRTRVFRMGHAAPVVPQFVLIDARTSMYPPAPHPVKFAESLHPGTTYVLVHASQGYTLMRRAR